MPIYTIYVNTGYDYEYETEIEAKSVHEARKLWKRRGDWKAINFKVSLKQAA